MSSNSTKWPSELVTLITLQCSLYSSGLREYQLSGDNSSFSLLTER